MRPICSCRNLKRYGSMQVNLAARADADNEFLRFRAKVLGDSWRIYKNAAFSDGKPKVAAYQK
jgi:hypothetical protein